MTFVQYQQSVMIMDSDSSKDDIEAVLSTLKTFHAKQETLCNRLETLADSLPYEFNSQEALIISRQITPLICEAHRFEENVLFPLIKDDKKSSQSLERLKFEHWEDEASGQDLSEALMSYVQSPQNNNTEKLSYMLRGFFDNLRRHMAFETEHIVPTIERRTQTL